MSDEKRCCICSQILGDSSNDLIAEFVGAGPYVRRIPLESDLFAVMPSLGALVPGHVLLCPKPHFKSFASIPEEYHAEFENLKRVLTDLLGLVYAEPVHYFEHGMARHGGRLLCTVEHAHLHAIPSSVDVWARLNVDCLWEMVDPDLTNLSLAVGELEYLYYERPNGEGHVCKAPPGHFESQYLRKIFAEELGNPIRWNWRDWPDAPAAHLIYERLRSSFAAIAMME